MFHQQMYIIFVFGLISTKFSIDLCLYVWNIIYGSIQGMIISIFIKLRYIYQFCGALISSWIKRIKAAIKRFKKKLQKNKDDK